MSHLTDFVTNVEAHVESLSKLIEHVLDGYTEPEATSFNKWKPSQECFVIINPKYPACGYVVRDDYLAPVFVEDATLFDDIGMANQFASLYQGVYVASYIDALMTSFNLLSAQHRIFGTSLDPLK